ncbi:hypothetical protein ASPBRDRAFT_340162 [Aspergillus brasiliensis CBS 101740]|uniref:Uncharacterized protein n=1 Tax=Aspergillus brasiliensis (strain CBS 101740 / IMI 381727 / IBT 21946) TaxID=767769 RepID=A0A1L9U731_ASPBC|nr:hypothetical protein ASPBRDRAFT_340162 [Aspergillus brasiliensis CBS 101740]
MKASAKGSQESTPRKTEATKDIIFTTNKALNDVMRVLIFNWLYEQEDGFMFPSLTDDNEGHWESKIQKNNRTSISENLDLALRIIARVEKSSDLGIDWIAPHDQQCLRQALREDEDGIPYGGLVDFDQLNEYIVREYGLVIVSKIERAGDEKSADEEVKKSADEKVEKDKPMWGRHRLGVLYPVENENLRNVALEYLKPKKEGERREEECEDVKTEDAKTEDLKTEDLKPEDLKLEDLTIT